MSLFTGIFLAALLLVPRSIYESYREHVRQGKRARMLPWLMAVVCLLALPYFYDELVGLEDPRVSQLLEWTIGACTYGLLLDIAWFLYRQYGPPSRRNRLPRT